MKQLAAMMALSAIAMQKDDNGLIQPDGKPVRLDSSQRSPKPRPKGLQQFFIDGNEVWAINEKNAIRKAKKKNYGE